MSKVHPVIVDLAAAREGRGLSVAEVARASGLDKSTVHGWERGTHSPRLAELSAYAACLGYRVTAEYAPSGPTVGELMTRLISTLHDLYLTPPRKGIS